MAKKEDPTPVSIVFRKVHAFHGGGTNLVWMEDGEIEDGTKNPHSARDEWCSTSTRSGLDSSSSKQSNPLNAALELQMEVDAYISGKRAKPQRDIEEEGDSDAE